MASTVDYGSVNRRSDHDASRDEEQPLLENLRAAPKLGWRGYMQADICRDWADLVLLACYVVTGLLDSAAISTWGSFVSMQTGLFSTLFFFLGRPS